LAAVANLDTTYPSNAGDSWGFQPWKNVAILPETAAGADGVMCIGHNDQVVWATIACACSKGGIDASKARDQEQKVMLEKQYMKRQPVSTTVATRTPKRPSKKQKCGRAIAEHKRKQSSDDEDSSDDDFNPSGTALVGYGSTTTGKKHEHQRRRESVLEILQVFPNQVQISVELPERKSGPPKELVSVNKNCIKIVIDSRNAHLFFGEKEAKYLIRMLQVCVCFVVPLFIFSCFCLSLMVSFRCH
jgi:hypothetical protein